MARVNSHHVSNDLTSIVDNLTPRDGQARKGEAQQATQRKYQALQQGELHLAQDVCRFRERNLVLRPETRRPASDTNLGIRLLVCGRSAIS